MLMPDWTPDPSGGASLGNALAPLGSAIMDDLGNLGQGLLGTIRDTVQAPVNVLTGKVAPEDIAGEARNEAGRLAGLGLGMPAPAGALRSFSVWHGTPHTFEPVEGNPFGEFSNTSIGSGEGAQAYGYGHYVAGNQGVATSYQKALSSSSRVTLDDKPVWDKLGAIGDDIYNEPEHVETAAKYLSDYKRHDDAVKAMSQQIDINNAASASSGLSQGAADHLSNVTADLQDAMQFMLQHGDRLKVGDGGHLLQVKVKPDESELLDWDKPVVEQSPEIQAKLKAAGWAPNEHLESRWASSGADAYHFMEGLGDGDPVQASAALHEAGIPGIKYLDAGSRNIQDVWKYKEQSIKNVGDDNEVNHAIWYLSNYGGGGSTKVEHLLADLKDRASDTSRPAISQYFEKAGQQIAANKQDFTYGPEKSATSNYVIFHPSNLHITARNGQQLYPIDHDPFAPTPVAHDPFVTTPVENDPFGGK